MCVPLKKYARRNVTAFHISTMLGVRQLCLYCGNKAHVADYCPWSSARLRDILDVPAAVSEVAAVPAAVSAVSAVSAVRPVRPVRQVQMAGLRDAPVAVVLAVAGYLAATPLLWLHTHWWRVCKTAAATASMRAVASALGMAAASVPRFVGVDEAGVAPWLCLATLHGVVCAPRQVDAATADEVALVQRLCSEQASRHGVWLLCQQGCTRAFLHLMGQRVAAVVSMRRCHDLSVQPAHKAVLGAHAAWHARLSSSAAGVMRLFVVEVVPKHKWQWQVLAVGFPCR
jgi:hypothetical protein